MINEEHLRAIEALLFVSKQPVTIAEIEYFIPALKGNKDRIFSHINKLKDFYNENSALSVLGGDEEGWLLGIDEDLHYFIEEPVILETEDIQPLPDPCKLALILTAYHQPITLPQLQHLAPYGGSIDQESLDILLNTGWLQYIGRQETENKPKLYGTTVKFLEDIGLSSLRHLPDLHEIDAVFGNADKGEVNEAEGKIIARTFTVPDKYMTVDVDSSMKNSRPPARQLKL